MKQRESLGRCPSRSQERLARLLPALAGLAAALAVAAAGQLPSWAAEPAPAAPAVKVSLAPVPRAEAVSSHSPFEAGECKPCHQKADAKAPGPVRLAAPAGCVNCHDEIDALAKAAKPSNKFKHPGRKSDCSTCHNPHNSKKKMLLL